MRQIFFIDFLKIKKAGDGGFLGVRALQSGGVVEIRIFYFQSTMWLIMADFFHLEGCRPKFLNY